MDYSNKRFFTNLVSFTIIIVITTSLVLHSVQGQGQDLTDADGDVIMVDAAQNQPKSYDQNSESRPSSRLMGIDLNLGI